MKIMIVDDHQAVLRQIVSLVLEEPLELFECESGEEAIVRYAAIEPDLVLMDIELKSMSGFEVTEQIYKQNVEAKIIIVTSYNTPTFRRKAKELHTHGFVCKDRLSDLHQLLQNLSA